MDAIEHWFSGDAEHWIGDDWSITWQGPYVDCFVWEIFPAGAAVDVAAGLVAPTASGHVDAPYFRGLRLAVEAVAAARR